ncbi:transcriptional corepressor LEUNIG_HOMOLOG-like isoform X2 [Cucumis melo var. makuwa]|uniref:Transcriptional corepressor LEUNIG_HOMOLOG-like isoform X2 n=1 Tax=Cucumis melo var. makuwa TaxID=1194695 RepID=A0A5A7TFB3_CUCMM|nr:transcriptional corepressor LEUNIG_HOMOLOG-like isoform X2 [Cucumis melo var. makuwa]
MKGLCKPNIHDLLNKFKSFSLTTFVPSPYHHRSRPHLSHRLKSSLLVGRYVVRAPINCHPKGSIDGTPYVHFHRACGGQKLRNIMLDSNIDLYGPYSRFLLNYAVEEHVGLIVEGKELLNPRTDIEKDKLKRVELDIDGVVRGRNHKNCVASLDENVICSIGDELCLWLMNKAIHPTPSCIQVGQPKASTNDDVAKVWKFGSGSKGDCIHELKCNGNTFHTCVFRPTDTSVLIIGSHESPKLWDTTENKTRTLKVHKKLVPA